MCSFDLHFIFKNKLFLFDLTILLGYKFHPEKT